MTDDPSTAPQLPGYTLVRRLGAGGYGEVWLAHAPGGLTKAVKFVFGSHHEKRAEHEFKALQRIKEVRHPFLLSLERIEIVEGRLAIVTELAEGSLKDRFDECRSQGLPGIPRDELLGHLRDAADALDVLGQKHGLQHLDVKPENLLLVGGHVKVADFGLVKDVGSTQASLVGGLTPLYSAPEVFQGAPGPRSDQYSLAVVYQEMLCGRPPFAGTTAAELTLQHLHDEPELSPLPMGDRFVVARALAKEAIQRYETCGELVRLLHEQRAAADWTGPVASAPFVADVERPPQPGPVTQVFDAAGDSFRREPRSSMLLTPQLPPLREPVKLPPLRPAAADEFSPRPTLVIGIGGLAASVLRHYRLSLVQRFGEGRIATLPLLLLDTDPRDLAAAQGGDSRGALRSEETLPLPLRRPQEYREQSSRLMGWLSRRWLYNIPKSLRTEGLRPLGRLALVDHARQAAQRIRIAMAQAVSEESREEARLATGCSFREGELRVIVVSSISGGTGGGMSLDVGGIVKTAADKLPLPRCETTGLFLHAAAGDPRRCDLARVNAFSWLTEFNHFQRPGGSFPGDETCGLPARDPARPLFDATYLVEADLADDQAPGSPRSIADFLYLDTVTPAQAFFEACRREPPSEPADYAALRTFRVRRHAAVAPEAVEASVALVAEQVLLNWTGAAAERSAQTPGSAATRDTDQLVAGAAQLVGKLQLKVDSLASLARGMVEAQFGGDVAEFCRRLLPPGPSPTSVLETLPLLDRLFAPPLGQEQVCYVLDRPVDAIVSPLTMRLSGDLRHWVFARLDDRKQRLAGAQRAIHWLVDHLQALDQDAGRLVLALQRQVDGALEQVRRNSRGGTDEARHAEALTYFRLRIDLCAVQAAAAVVRRLMAEMRDLQETMTELSRNVKHLARSVAASADQASAEPLTELTAQRLAELGEAVDARLQREFVDEQGGLLQALMGHSRVRAQLQKQLRQGARDAVESLVSRAVRPQAPALAELSDAMDVAACLSRGGGYRQLLALPGDGPLEAGDPASVGCGGRDRFFCLEGERAPLPWVAADLIQGRRDYADFAARVHARQDVAWQPLISAAAPAIEPAPFDDPVPVHVPVAV